MTRYRVEVDGLEELAELKGGWLPSDYIAVLERLEVADAAQIPADELREMCLLALQDLEPSKAAALLLKYRLGTKLSDGQIRNYSVESQHERLWEQAADLEFHHTMFNVASLLNAANDMAFPAPDALRVSLLITCDDPAMLVVFDDAMDRQFLIRLLSAGMPETAILNRLFGEQIANGKISDAGSIIWGVHAGKITEGSVCLKVISSAYWLSGLRETESFEWDSTLVAR